MDEPIKLPPIKYAKLRGLYPQKVYAAIRGGRLKEGLCDCGRKIVVVEEADKFFKVGAHAEGEVPSTELDDKPEPSGRDEHPPDRPRADHSLPDG